MNFIRSLVSRIGEIVLIYLKFLTLALIIYGLLYCYMVYYVGMTIGDSDSINTKLQQPQQQQQQPQLQQQQQPIHSDL